jgi:hypothetical protein
LSLTLPARTQVVADASGAYVTSLSLFFLIRLLGRPPLGLGAAGPRQVRDAAAKQRPAANNGEDRAGDVRPAALAFFDGRED